MAQSSSNSSSSTTRRSLRLLAAEKKSNSTSSTIETPEDDSSSQSNPRQAKSKALEALSHTQTKRRRESEIDLSDETDESATKRRIGQSQRKSSSKRQRASISDDEDDEEESNNEQRRKTSEPDRPSESPETGNHCLRRGSGGRDLHPLTSEPSTSHRQPHHHSRRSRRYSPKPYLDYLSTSQSRLPALTNSNPSETRLCDSSHPSSSDPPIHLFHSPTYFPSTSSPPRSASSAQSYSGLVPNSSNRNPSTTAKPSLTMSTESDTDPETSPTSRDLISDPSFLRAAASSGSASAAFLQTLSGRVHHLMSRVGGNSSLNSRLQQYIQGMQSPDPDVKLSTLNELCSLLVMSNEDTLPSFQCRALYGPLRDCLADENEANSEIVLTACRALTYLMEALPRAAMQVVEATPIFLSKLRSITSIDIAEQALIALEMISRRNAKQILLADGIAACLAFIEFFSITSQNKALTIVANCCSHINTPNEFKYIREHLSVLAARLQSDDKKTIEHVCTIFSRLVENFHRDATILCEIVSTDLLKTFQTMIVVQPSLLNSVTFLSIIHLLYICSASCPQLAVTLLKMNIAETLVCLLTGSAEGRSVVRKSITYKSAVLPNNGENAVLTSIQSHTPIELVSRTPQELYEIVSLIGEMMPKLPSDEPLFQVEQYFHSTRLDDPQAASPALWHWQDDDGQLRPYSFQESRLIEAAWQQHEEEIQLTIEGRHYLLDLQQFQQVNEETNQARFIKRIVQSSSSPAAAAAAAESLTTISKPNDARMEILHEHLDLYQSFVQALFTVLYEVYNSSAGPAVKHRCLQSLLRMIFYSPSELLETILRQQSISSHIASMLASSDPKIVISALQISEILMKKLPEIFSVYFYREGVIHQIEILIGLGVASSSNLSVSSHGRAANPTDSAHLPSPSSQTNLTHRGATSQMHSKSSSTPYRGSSRRYANDSTNQRVETRAQRAAAARTKSLFDSTRPTGATSNRIHVPMGFASATPTASSLFFASNNDEKNHFKEWIENQARHFRSTYFAENSSQSNIALEIIHRLASAVDRLHVGKDQQENQRALKDIAQILSKGDVSPFEIVHSGLISKLFQYLTDDLTVPNERFHRLKVFLQIFASLPEEKELKQFIIDLHHQQIQQEKSSGNVLHHLISKLHGCINQLEQFPIRVNDTAGRSVHQSALRLISSHQLKCHLLRHPQCKTLKQWNSGPVKIDPFALVSVLEKYLLLRGIASGPMDDPSETIDDEDSEVSNESDDDIINVLAHSPSMRLEFLINEHVIPPNMTLFQAIRMYGRSTQRMTDEESETDNDESIFPSTALWTRVHTITYRQVNSSSSGVPAVSQAIGGATTTTTTSTASSRMRPNAPTTSSSSASSTSKTSKKNNKTPKRTSAPPLVDDLWLNGHSPPSKSLLQEHLNESIGSILTINDLSLNAISLLHILNALNLFWYDLYRQTNTMLSSEQQSTLTLTPANEFISSKLTSKVNRQLQDPVVLMMGHIPSWITEIGYKCAFLFPFETRQMIFYTNAFDRERAMQRLIDNSDLLSQQQQQQQSQQQEAHERQNLTPRVERKKIQLSRANILNEMEKVLENWNSKHILEVQYEDEVGFGLGPTLEAYSLISKELQKTGLELWRTDKTLELYREKEQTLPEYVDNRYGLYPAPLGRNAKSNLVTKVRQKFKFLGKFMAKALMDSRMIDMPFSLVFYKWILADEDSLTLEDLHHVDRNLYEQLKKLQTVVQRRDELLAENQNACAKTNSTVRSKTTSIEEDPRLHLDGCSIEDLGLVFTLPAYPQIELKKNGKDCSVTILNLDQYIQLVVHWTLIEGVRRQFESFRDGFNSIFPLNHLKAFYSNELHQVFCGSGSTDFWDLKVLLESTRCDHGYNLNSRAVKWLFELMVNFDLDEQRAFLQFVTGSPRLPVGGFRMLHPPLTIVRKTAENTSETNQTDQALPSVMTCVNYLKLPDYSSKEIMKVKLTTAIRDGQYAFLLS